MQSLMGVSIPIKFDPVNYGVVDIAAKGVCTKCDKHIGRGVKFHEKHCKGK